MTNKELEIYLVGGAVRDELLQRPVQERDWVVVGATPDAMLKQGFKKVGKDFPVFLHPDSKEEYALARTERKTAAGYYGFECIYDPTVSLEEDLERRDLTINAIAKTADGRLIDPFGGVKDIQHKVLRHVSPAFSEDPVRILRLARFMARFADLGFTVAAATMRLMQDMVAAQEVAALVPERVWKELSRLLAENNPVAGIETLRECGALKVIFPALERLWGIPQKPKWHPEIDTGVHIMMALAEITKMTPDPIIRFAVLCHDLGKGTTPAAILPSHHGHEERGVKLIKNWCQQYRVPNVYQELAVKVSRWHLHSHLAFELTAKTFMKLFKGLDVFRKPALLEDFLLACKADALGRGGDDPKTYPQYELITKVYLAAKSVSTAEFIAAGLTGKALGSRLHQQQVAEISKVLAAEKKNL